jgi:hypothetical protein
MLRQCMRPFGTLQRLLGGADLEGFEPETPLN